MTELDLSALPEPELLTDEQRDELIRYALSGGEGPVSRYVIAYETVLTDGGMKIAMATSSDTPWVQLGLAGYLWRTLEDQTQEDT